MKLKCKAVSCLCVWGPFYAQKKKGSKLFSYGSWSMYQLSWFILVVVNEGFEV
jgi:hypothetical protein